MVHQLIQNFQKLMVNWGGFLGRLLGPLLKNDLKNGLPLITMYLNH